MLKRLFIRLYRLIAEPTPAWQDLSNEQDRQNEGFYNTFLFPILGIIALLSFLGLLISPESFDFSSALKTVLKQVLITGGSFYLSAYSISRWLFPRVDLSPNRFLSERFTGYASSMIFAIVMLKSLFPSLFFLEIISIYTFYMVWVAASVYLKISEEHLVRFTVIAGIMILLLPAIIGGLIRLLMPNF